MIHTRVSFADRFRREQKAVFINQGVVETVHLPVHVGFNVTVALIEIGAFLCRWLWRVIFRLSLLLKRRSLEMFLVMLCRLDLK